MELDAQMGPQTTVQPQSRAEGRSGMHQEERCSYIGEVMAREVSDTTGKDGNGEAHTMPCGMILYKHRAQRELKQQESTTHLRSPTKDIYRNTTQCPILLLEKLEDGSPCAF